MNFIISVVTNIFRMYLIRRFIQIMLGETEQQKIKEFIAYGLFFAANIILFFYFHLAWVNIVCNLVGISVVMHLYTKSIKTNIFLTTSIYLVNMICDLLAVLLFVDYQDGSEFSQIYAAITVFLIFICELIAERIVNCQKKVDNVESLPLLVMPLSSIIVLTLLIYTSSCTYKGIIISFGLLAVNMLMLYLYNLIMKSTIQKYENEILKQKADIYSNQLEILLQSEDRIKCFRHDMKHHLNEIKLLAINNEVEVIQKYIDDMEDFINNPDEIVASGNKEIDSVLNYMIQKAKQELYSVHVKVLLPKAMSHSFDINVILGNLLENAIEAAIQTKEKELNLDIQMKQDVLKIEISNSFCGAQSLMENSDRGKIRYATTKKDGIHGIGLNSVNKIVEKYDGVMEVDSSEKRFTVRLLLYNVQGENLSCDI